MRSIKLSVSIVLYMPDENLLIKTIQSLQHSIDFLNSKRDVRTQLILVDNSEYPDTRQLSDILQQYCKIESHLTFNKINLGFSKAHNQAISNTDADFHLVLNPDVLLEKDALYYAIEYLESHHQTVLISPNCQDDEGNKQYLCKNYPSLLDLFLRGFMPEIIRKLFKKRLNHYQLKGLTEHQTFLNPFIASGCFMLFRREAFCKIKGFNEQFFLYFEDFDLSIRIATLGQIVYLPEVKISHFGGNTAKKGIRHIYLFVQSMIIFFNIHGWKLF